MNRRAPHYRSAAPRSESSTTTTTSLFLFGCVAFVFLMCGGIPVYLAGLALVLSTKSTHIAGCIALCREEDRAWFLNQCTGEQLPLPFRFDSYAHVEWGSDARTGLLWLYIPEPTLGLLEERWVLMQACETYQQTRVFERPEQVNDALMRQHGVLIDVADSLQPLDEPQPLLW